jgi:hypothetical protein
MYFQCKVAHEEIAGQIQMEPERSRWSIKKIAIQSESIVERSNAENEIQKKEEK